MLLQGSVTPTLQPLLGACQCCTTLPCSPEVLIFLDQVQMTQAVILHAGQEGTEPLKTSQDRLPASSWKQVLNSATFVGDHMHGSGRMSLGMLSSRMLPVTSQQPSQTTPGIPTCCGQGCSRACILLWGHGLHAHPPVLQAPVAATLASLLPALYTCSPP